MTSVIVIGGILVTGALGLLRVNEFWLASRRAAPYLLVGLAIAGSQIIKRPLLETFIGQIIDTKKLEKNIRQKGVEKQVSILYRRLSWLASALFFAIAATTYLVTRFVITSAPLSTQFNEELAKLRLYSIGTVTIPLLVGGVVLTLYLFLRLEKLTGLSVEEITKVK